MIDRMILSRILSRRPARRTPVYAEVTINAEMIEAVDWPTLRNLREEVAAEVMHDLDAPDLIVGGNVIEP